MKIFGIFLFLCANSFATIVDYYRKCYEDFSLCLITNNYNPYYGSKFRLNRSSADEWCKEQSSSLAIITNETVQSAIEAFINDSSAKLDWIVITNGDGFNLTTWQWINGEQSVIYPNSDVDYHYLRYAFLVVSTNDGTSISFHGHATINRKFICTFLNYNSSCPGGHIQFRWQCYKIHHQNVTWFDARRICLKHEGSDLATFEDGLPSLAAERGRNDEYWIGLRKGRWAWYNGLTSVDLKYSNWRDGSPGSTERNCLCLLVTTGKWITCNCTWEYRYICIQDYASGSASAMIASTTTTTTAATKPATTATNMTTTIKQPTTTTTNMTTTIKQPTTTTTNMTTTIKQPTTTTTNMTTTIKQPTTTTTNMTTTIKQPTTTTKNLTKTIKNPTTTTTNMTTTVTKPTTTRTKPITTRTKPTTTRTKPTTTRTKPTTKMTTTTATRKTTQSTASTVGDSSSSFNSTSTQTQNDYSKHSSGIILALGIGSACLLILIVVIAVVAFIKNRRSRYGDVGPRNGNTMHNDDAPNTVYAEIISNANEPVRSPQEKTSNQTVYAELDLEPKRKITQKASEPVQGPSEKASNQAVYAEVVSKGNKETTHGGAVQPESEYANSSLVDSVYANSAQTKV